MTRDELLALPPTLALKVLVSAMVLVSPELGKVLAATELPKVPRMPKYDMRISRKGGYQWASETDLEGLRFWFKRYTDNVNEGGRYAEKDGKRAEKLCYWLDWREACPDTIWTGQRNDDVVTAVAPSGKPAVHEWEQRGQVPLKGKSFEEEHGETDEIPF
jgi:hypothetical protein